MWLDSIGVENINPTKEQNHICSLHIAKESINKTLDVVRLCDDAVSTIFPAAQLANKINNLKSINSQDQSRNQAQVIPQQVDSAFKHHLTPGPSRLPISTTSLTKLKEKLTTQKNKIKRLTEKCRRQ